MSLIKYARNVVQTRVENVPTVVLRIDITKAPNRLLLLLKITIYDCSENFLGQKYTLPLTESMGSFMDITNTFQNG
ncbi:MAG: hypothetical protein MJA31_07920 [Clostridia bacterium]|nr:hypothetical protein [Clostridia bacterium]